MCIHLLPNDDFLNFILENMNNVVYNLCTVRAQHCTYLSHTTAPPFISDIIQPNIVYAQVPTDLKCTIRGARQQQLKVKWFKLRRDAESDVQSETVSLLFSEDLSDQASLQSEGKHHTAVLTVCLTVTEDCTRYQCVVQWGTRSVSREATVKVKGQ